MKKSGKKEQKKSLKATHEQEKRLKDAERFYLRKGFRSFKAVCDHAGIDQSNGRKAFIGIHTHKKALDDKKKLEELIEFKQG